MPTAARPWRSCSNAGRAASLVASHDRTLLERVDRIVELTPIGISIFGGGWSAFAEAREAARARAADDLGRASDALRNTERALQKAHEKKARRDKAGRAWRAKGIEDKMFMDREKARAENSAARESRLAGRLLGERAEALELAKAQVEILTPLSIDLPRTELPGGRELLALKDVVAAFGERHLFGPLSFEVRGPERIAIRGANGSGKTTLFSLITGELKPRAATSAAAPTGSPCSINISACSIRLEHSRQSAPPQSGTVGQ
jgi:ATPase subunit of ABC transporter with duplicated ATPase domains